MRTNKLWFAIAASLASYAIAQEPPRLQKLEEGEPPAVTIRKPEQKSTIQEKRAPGGKVTEVKVTSGGSNYVVKPNDPPGSTLPGDTQANTTRPAQWEVLEFDLGRKAEQMEGEGAMAVQPDVPPPPSPNAPAPK
jgi:hypothetical protein